MDGVNITSGTSLYVTNDRKYMLEATTQNMTSYATIGGSNSSYIRDISAGVLFISSSTTSGSSSTYTGDALYVTSGDRNMVVGGSALSSEEAGILSQNYTLSSTGTWSGGGSRITFASESL